jgi:protein-tyrosine-phosphatase
VNADSLPLDFVFTVCDKAAGEACPFWPGQPITAQWAVEDPAGFEGPVEEQRRLSYRVYSALDNRIKLFTNLPLDSIDMMALQHRLDEIGRELPE